MPRPSASLTERGPVTDLPVASGSVPVFHPLKAIWLSLRPHQWTKNLVVFAAPALSKHLFERGPLVQSVLAFVVFCGLSGTVYLVNDVADVEQDRLHPRKRLRPIASGALMAGVPMHPSRAVPCARTAPPGGPAGTFPR